MDVGIVYCDENYLENSRNVAGSIHLFCTCIIKIRARIINLGDTRICIDI